MAVIWPRSLMSIKSGLVAVGGSTGLVLSLSLMGLRDLIARSPTCAWMQGHNTSNAFLSRNSSKKSKSVPRFRRGRAASTLLSSPLIARLRSKAIGRSSRLQSQTCSTTRSRTCWFVIEPLGVNDAGYIAANARGCIDTTLGAVVLEPIKASK